MSADLARLFAPTPDGAGAQPLIGAQCTAWDSTTNYSTVVVGSVVTYANLPILSSGLATMGVGLVLLINTDRGPIIIGRLTVPV